MGLLNVSSQAVLWVKAVGQSRRKHFLRLTCSSVLVSTMAEYTSWAESPNQLGHTRYAAVADKLGLSGGTQQKCIACSCYVPAGRPAVLLHRLHPGTQVDRSSISQPHHLEHSFHRCSGWERERPENGLWALYCLSLATAYITYAQFHCPKLVTWHSWEMQGNTWHIWRAYYCF